MPLGVTMLKNFMPA